VTFSLESLKETRMYQATSSATQFRDDFRRVFNYSAEARKKKKRYDLIAMGTGTLTFFGFFWAVSVPLLFFIPLISLIVTIRMIMLGKRWRYLHIRSSDVRYQLPLELSEMLSRDMAEEAPIDMKIDFSPPMLLAKLVHEAPWPKRKDWKQQLFEDPWLQLSGCFLDGTFFTLKLSELTVIRSGYKRGSSGKRKFKTKIKPKGMDACLMLNFSRKKYGAITALQSDLINAINLPPDVQLKKLKANDHQLMLSAKVPAYESQTARQTYLVFTQMLLSAYQCLNLSKVLSKSSV